MLTKKALSARANKAVATRRRNLAEFKKTRHNAAVKAWKTRTENN